MINNNLDERIEKFYEARDELNQKKVFYSIWSLYREHFPEDHVGSKKWKEKQNGKINDSTT